MVEGHSGKTQKTSEEVEFHFQLVSTGRLARLEGITGNQIFARMQKFLEAKMNLLEMDMKRFSMEKDVVRYHLAKLERDLLEGVFIWMDHHI